jgi:hypothetical protein
MFCSMPVIGGLLLFLNYGVLPRIGPSYYRPSWVALTALVVTTLLYFSAAVVYVLVSLS